MNIHNANYGFLNSNLLFMTTINNWYKLHVCKGTVLPHPSWGQIISIWMCFKNSSIHLKRIVEPHVYGSLKQNYRFFFLFIFLTVFFFFKWKCISDGRKSSAKYDIDFVLTLSCFADVKIVSREYNFKLLHLLFLF